MNSTRNKLDQLWQRGQQFLGSRYAIMGGAMTWVSERNLVAAISSSGGFGTLACGAMSPELLTEEIEQTRVLTSLPFGVNLIILHPQIKELTEVCIEQQVSHVILGGGIPSEELISRLRRTGIKTACFAPSLVVAKKLARMGADALIIEGTEAGGHIGPVATSVLAQEILPHVRSVPVFIAGGIGRGEAIAAYLEMGAAGVQLGTRFVCAHESMAHFQFKRAFIKASARDAVPSVQLDSRFPVIPVRALVNDGMRRFVDTQREVIEQFNRGELSKQQARLAIEHFWDGALKRAVLEGDITCGSLMAGQSVGMVTCQEPCADILEGLLEQALASLHTRL